MKSGISALTPEGRLLMRTQDHADTSTEVVRFLRHLVRQGEGKLRIIWDGARIHRSQPLKAFLAAGGAQRIHLERFRLGARAECGRGDLAVSETG